jgi:hypothetical protein
MPASGQLASLPSNWQALDRVDILKTAKPAEADLGMQHNLRSVVRLMSCDNRGNKYLYWAMHKNTFGKFVLGMYTLDSRR